MESASLKGSLRPESGAVGGRGLCAPWASAPEVLHGLPTSAHGRAAQIVEQLLYEHAWTC